jgi:2-hydroxychromene-2-carboxylate isomerase
MIEFFYDIGSPYSYLAAERLQGLEERTGAEVRWRPFLLSGVFRQVGDDPSVQLGPRRRYMVRDLGRWAARIGVPLNFPDSFPVNTLDAMRVLVRTERAKRPERSMSLFRALWGEGRDLSNPETLRNLVGEEGLALGAGVEAMERLEQTTEEAVARGAFGSPSFFVGRKLFFGNDRMDFLEAAILAQKEGDS